VLAYLDFLAIKRSARYRPSSLGGRPGSRVIMSSPVLEEFLARLYTDEPASEMPRCRRL
jgi:hypothetical protein